MPRVQCDQCDFSFAAAVGDMGRDVACPKCGELFTAVPLEPVTSPLTPVPRGEQDKGPPPPKKLSRFESQVLDDSRDAISLLRDIRTASVTIMWIAIGVVALWVVGALLVALNWPRR